MRICSVSAPSGCPREICVPCELQFTCSSGTYIWTLDSCHTSMQLYVAAAPRGLAHMSKRVFNLHSVCSVLPVLFCGYKVSSLVGILADMPFVCRAQSIRWCVSGRREIHIAWDAHRKALRCTAPGASPLTIHCHRQTLCGAVPAPAWGEGQAGSRQRQPLQAEGQLPPLSSVEHPFPKWHGTSDVTT